MKIKASIWLIAAMCAGQAVANGLSLRPSTGLQLPPVATHASTHSTSSAVATTSSQGGAAQGVGSQGQSLSIDSHAVYQAQARNPVSTAIAPPLTSSNDTCMGSTSVGGSSVGFSFSVGSTWTDGNCVMLKNAREIWNMGFKGAALARLCMDALNKEAFEATGIKCPPRANQNAAAVPASTTAQVGDNTGYMTDLYAN